MGWQKSKFRIAEMAEPDDMTITYGSWSEYVKVGNSYMRAIYHSPDCGPTDGHIYVKKGSSYFRKNY